MDCGQKGCPLLPALHSAILSEVFNKGRDREGLAQVVLFLGFNGRRGSYIGRFYPESPKRFKESVQPACQYERQARADNNLRVG